MGRGFECFRPPKLNPPPKKNLGGVVVCGGSECESCRNILSPHQIQLGKKCTHQPNIPSLHTLQCAVVATLFLAASTGCVHPAMVGQSTPSMVGHSAPSQPDQTVAAQMVALGAEHAHSYLDHTETESIRNMLGGARGIFLAPKIVGGAALVGYETALGTSCAATARNGATESSP